MKAFLIALCSYRASTWLRRASGAMRISAGPSCSFPRRLDHRPAFGGALLGVVFP